MFLRPKNVVAGENLERVYLAKGLAVSSCRFILFSFL